MEVKPPSSRQKMGLAALIVCLVLVAAGMGVLLYVTLHSVDQVKSYQRPGMIRLAWVTLLVLAVVLVLLLWALIRIIALRLRPQPHEQTPYVDAWALAGRRADAPKPDGDDQDGGPDEGSEDEDGKLDGDGDGFSPPGGKN
jgi:hypothetical protein